MVVNNKLGCFNVQPDFLPQNGDIPETKNVPNAEKSLCNQLGLFANATMRIWMQ